jgi:hypothetical protein
MSAGSVTQSYFEDSQTETVGGGKLGSMKAPVATP